MCTYFFAIKFVYSFNAILLTYVPKGVFTKRRYPRLWLTSKLDAHFAGMRTLAPFGAVFDIGFLSATYKIANAVYTKQKPPYPEVSYVPKGVFAKRRYPR